MSKVLIALSNYHQEISDILLSSVLNELSSMGIEYHRINVVGAFELASSINIGLESSDYDGVIALGCIVKGDTINYELISREVTRALQDISIYYSMPLGFGVLTVNDTKQAFARAVKYGQQAALACIQMMKIKEHFTAYNEKEFSRFN